MHVAIPREVLLTAPCPKDATTCQIVSDWTGSRTTGHLAGWLIGTPLAVLGILVVAFAIRWLLHRAISRVVRRASAGVLPTRIASHGLSRVTIGDPGVAARRSQRVQAMGSLLKSVVSGVVIAIAIVMVLSAVGVDVAPVIAGAGIVGVALGFGSQSLVTDFLSGTFMIFEDQYGVGDVVDVGEASGTVEAVGLRVTRLRDVDGTVWYVRNGEIVRVGNMSQNWARTVLDIAVSYAEDLDRVSDLLREVAQGMWQDEDFSKVVIEEPEVWGVQAFEPDRVIVRVTLKTAPLEQWAVAREMRERIKKRFDLEGIEIPLPQRVVWHHQGGPVPAADEVGPG